MFCVVKFYYGIFIKKGTHNPDLLDIAEWNFDRMKGCFTLNALPIRHFPRVGKADISITSTAYFCYGRFLQPVLLEIRSTNR